MRLNLVVLLIVMISQSEFSYSQSELYYNRIHLFDHQDCKHPIGTLIDDKVFYANNENNSHYLSFNNSDGEIVYADLTNYGKYTAYNEFKINDFRLATKLIMRSMQRVSSVAESVKKAKSQFILHKSRDTIVGEKTLQHIRIEPRDTLAHRFDSYNLVINTETENETLLLSSPTVYFLILESSLKDLKGTVVETYFVDLEGNLYCRDVLTAFQVTNKRVTVQ